MKALLSIFAAVLALAAHLALPGGALALGPVTGHAFLAGGAADFSKDWDFSFRDELTGEGRDFDLTGQLKYGAQFDFNLRGRRGELIPFNLFLAAYATDVAKSGFVSHSLPADHYLTSRCEASVKTIELDVGGRYYLGGEEEAFVPFVGAGGAVVAVDYSVTKTATLVKLNTNTNLYDLVQSDSSTEAKKGNVLGVWGAAGLLWKPLWKFAVGVEGRYIRGLTKVGGRELSSLEGMLLLGFEF